jgi:hypothetical protein
MCHRYQNIAAYDTLSTHFRYATVVALWTVSWKGALKRICLKGSEKMISIHYARHNEIIFSHFFTGNY